MLKLFRSTRRFAESGGVRTYTVKKELFVMITLTRFNGNPVLINEDLIETCEETPDTVVSLHNGHKYFVKEKLGEILCLSIDFKRSCQNIPLLSDVERAAVFAVTNPNNTVGGQNS